MGTPLDAELLRPRLSGSFRRRVKSRCALFLLLTLLSLVLAASISPATFGGQPLVLSTLKDPLSLFAERSPGERGSGPLLLTKAPYERVHPSAHGEAPPGTAPLDLTLDSTPANLAMGNGAPGYADSSPEQIFGAPSPASFAIPLGFSNQGIGAFPSAFIAPGQMEALPQSGPSATVSAPLEQIAEVPTGPAPVIETPIPGSAEALPTFTGTPLRGTPAGALFGRPLGSDETIPIPEPTTWTMMLLGCVALFVLRLRRTSSIMGCVG